MRVVRFQHLHPICIAARTNVGNKETTSKLMFLVELLNLTFDFETNIEWVSNVKFVPLEQFHPNASRLGIPFWDEH
jgi:hypothetical protein